MTSASALVPAMQHLADTYAKGDLTKVTLMMGEYNDTFFHVYMTDKPRTDFTPETIQYMKSLGFTHTSHRDYEKGVHFEGSVAYSYFDIFI